MYTNWKRVKDPSIGWPFFRQPLPFFSHFFRYISEAPARGQSHENVESNLGANHQGESRSRNRKSISRRPQLRSRCRKVNWVAGSIAEQGVGLFTDVGNNIKDSDSIWYVFEPISIFFLFFNSFEICIKCLINIQTLNNFLKTILLDYV